MRSTALPRNFREYRFHNRYRLVSDISRDATLCSSYLAVGTRLLARIHRARGSRKLAALHRANLQARGLASAEGPELSDCHEIVTVNRINRQE